MGAWGTGGREMGALEVGARETGARGTGDIRALDVAVRPEGSRF